MTLPAFPLPSFPRFPGPGDFLPSPPEFPFGIPDLGIDRAVAGLRGIEETAELAALGFYWARDAWRTYQTLQVNGAVFLSGIGYGVVAGMETVDASGNVVPGAGALPWSVKSARRRMASFSTPWYIGYRTFWRGLGDGLWNELAGIPELAMALYDGTLITAFDEALRAIAGSEKTAFALGQQIGAASFQDLLRAADLADDDAFAYQVGLLAGSWIPDLIVLVFTWGAGTIPKLGLKVGMWSEKSILLAGKLVRRFRGRLQAIIDKLPTPDLHLPEFDLVPAGGPGRIPDVPSPPARAVAKRVIDGDPPGPSASKGSSLGVSGNADRGLTSAVQAPGPGVPAPAPPAPTAAGAGALRKATVPATATSAALGVAGRKATAVRAAAANDAAKALFSKRSRTPDLARRDAAVARAGRAKAAGGKATPQVRAEPELGPLLKSVRDDGAMPEGTEHLRERLLKSADTRGTGGIQHVNAAILEKAYFDVDLLPSGTPDASVTAIRTQVSGVVLPRTLDRKAISTYNSATEWTTKRKAVKQICASESLPYDNLDAMHAWGPGFGDEARAGMGLGPKWVNQKAQAGAISREMLGVDSLSDARRHGPYEGELIKGPRSNQPGIEGSILDYSIAMQERGAAMGEDFVVGLDVTTTTWGDELLGDPLFVAAKRRGDNLLPQDFVREVTYDLQTYRKVGDRLEPVPGDFKRLQMQMSAPPDSPVIVIHTEASINSPGESRVITKADLVKE